MIWTSLCSRPPLFIECWGNCRGDWEYVEDDLQVDQDLGRRACAQALSRECQVEDWEVQAAHTHPHHRLQPRDEGSPLATGSCHSWCGPACPILGIPGKAEKDNLLKTKEIVLGMLAFRKGMGGSWDKFPISLSVWCFLLGPHCWGVNILDSVYSHNGKSLTDSSSHKKNYLENESSWSLCRLPLAEFPDQAG